jgi:hypothetical protein
MPLHPPPAVFSTHDSPSSCFPPPQVSLLIRHDHFLRTFDPIIYETVMDEMVKAGVTIVKVGFFLLFVDLLSCGVFLCLPLLVCWLVGWRSSALG